MRPSRYFPKAEAKEVIARVRKVEDAQISMTAEQKFTNTKLDIIIKFIEKQH